MDSEKSIFSKFSEIFKKFDIPPVLVGGYALIANKVQRMTFDIDFLISEEKYAKIEQEILNIGFEIFHKQEAFVQFKSDREDLIDTDFHLSDSNTIDIIVSKGNKHIIDNIELIVPSPLHLIAMKLHSISYNKNRELKDLPDIIQLIEINKININDKELRYYFENYKLNDLYYKVKTILKEKNG